MGRGGGGGGDVEEGGEGGRVEVTCFPHCFCCQCYLAFSFFIMYIGFTF